MKSIVIQMLIMASTMASPAPEYKEFKDILAAIEMSHGSLIKGSKSMTFYGNYNDKIKKDRCEFVGMFDESTDHTLRRESLVKVATKEIIRNQ